MARVLAALAVLGLLGCTFDASGPALRREAGRDRAAESAPPAGDALVGDGPAACGKPGQTCCSSVPACSDPRTVCAASICVACGSAAQPCCGIAPGCEVGLMCADSNCKPCGAATQPCCDTAPACATGNVCETGVCNKVSCGAAGQPCCQPGNTCTVGTCNGTTCQPPPACGADGQICCTGDKCNGGLICKGGQCKNCGDLLQPCCSADKCNSWGYICDQNKVCVVCGTSGVRCCFGTCLPPLQCMGGKCTG
jgi:hypothetical protein